MTPDDDTEAGRLAYNLLFTLLALLASETPRDIKLKFQFTGKNSATIALFIDDKLRENIPCINFNLGRSVGRARAVDLIRFRLGGLVCALTGGKFALLDDINAGSTIHLARLL
ncbi:MAG: hypothetical protein AAB367_04435 [Patescibacteria group bacterium]